MSKATSRRQVPALRVHQWLPEWDDVVFAEPSKRKPPDHFFVLSMTAGSLRALCGIERRDATTGKRRKSDAGIQRSHDESRSQEIARFVKHGYPWSVLGRRRRESGEFDDLKQPGWLPTAIVINIRTPKDQLGGRKVHSNDLVSVEEGDNGVAMLDHPASSDGDVWVPQELEPVEVIDGQHRLWAFEPGEDEADFDLPVVAFVGLARSWQAYLFWTINIKPKRINASLAYDLYPLLRNQDWLERFEGPAVYRETRAQELTEMLWAHPASPWHDRINMLGERGVQGVRQAAWVRALTSSYVKSSQGPGVRIGGLFGAPVGKHETVLPWSREQQAAFLIYVWQEIKDAVEASDSAWAKQLREAEAEASGGDTGGDEAANERDPAFAGRYSLLNTDQGVRGVLIVTNDLCFLATESLDFDAWSAREVTESADEKEVSRQLASLSEFKMASFVREIAKALAKFDWRTSGTPDLTEDERLRQAAYRGSSGYRELRRQLLAHLESSGPKRVAALATRARTDLKLD